MENCCLGGQCLTLNLPDSLSDFGRRKLAECRQGDRTAWAGAGSVAEKATVPVALTWRMAVRNRRLRRLACRDRSLWEGEGLGGRASGGGPRGEGLGGRASGGGPRGEGLGGRASGGGPRGEGLGGRASGGGPRGEGLGGRASRPPCAPSGASSLRLPRCACAPLRARRALRRDGGRNALPPEDGARHCTSQNENCCRCGGCLAPGRASSQTAASVVVGGELHGEYGRGGVGAGTR